jgi:23S rRNA (cytosine1962-C5)-methyltransferase
VRLRRDVAGTIRRGHPWIWADAVDQRSDLPAGSVVDVLDGAGRFVARGLWDPGSPIAVRVWTLDPDETLDDGLVERRVAVALDRRSSFFDVALTNAFRLIHGEADGLPGLVVDRYAGTAVVRFDGEAAASLRDVVREAVHRVPGMERVVERTGRKTRSDRSSDHGPEPFVIRENGLRFEVDVIHGHKTGLYLDQRDSRARVRDIAAGRRLLNLFSYTGGFTVAAAAGGCASSLSVDVAAPALGAVRRNLELNGLSSKGHEVLAGDVIAMLQGGAFRAGEWDLVVVDPPSFAPNRASLARALDVYRKLNAAVLRLVEPGGLVLTCSCSSHVDRRRFIKVLRDAAREAGVQIERRAVWGAGPDHPVIRSFPEGEYLKAVQLEVTRESRFSQAARGARGARGR